MAHQLVKCKTEQSTYIAIGASPIGERSMTCFLCSPHFDRTVRTSSTELFPHISQRSK